MTFGPRARRAAGALAAPLAGMAMLGLAVLLVVLEPGAKARLLDLTYDTLQRLAPRPYTPEKVRIVDIDEESLARFGQWPWPRSRLAELVEKLRAQGAAAIAFDIVFGEPDRTSPGELAKLWPESAPARALLDDLPDPDRRLADAIRPGAVVTAFALNDEGGTARPQDKARFAVAGPPPEAFLPGFSGASTTLPLLESAAAGNGAINFVPDGDGIVRRVPLLYVLDGRRFEPALAAEALRVASGARNYVIRSGGVEAGLSSVAIGRSLIPTDHRGNVWLHFTRNVPERRIPAWRVLDEASPPAGLAGGIVFVGTSAPGLRDLRLSPLGVIAGAETHAQLVEQVLAGWFLVRPDGAATGELLVLVAAGALIAVMVGLVGPLGSAAAMLTLVMLGLGTTGYAFRAWHILLEPLSPALGVLAVFLTASVVQHMRDARQERWIRHAFSSYVSPNLVEHLIERPERLRLGGERRECSFVLTDLAGFTTVVERSDPARLVSLMNEYLDGMVGIAFRHEGTLDRIVGDAVAVMFSAPIEQPDHPARAVACALEMDRFAEAFRRAKNDEGVPLGLTRIGVHSGPVIVGNFGGAHTFDYRALGDAINTTARLETANRHFGTRVCISGETASRSPGFVGRPVGRLVLKGKSETVAAFEPLHEADADHPRQAQYRDAYATMESADPAARELFAALAARYPDDPLVRFHHERLERGDTGALIVLGEK
jgi:adenylate cyclase